MRAVQDLFILTNDPLLQKRVMKADTNRDGRIGRREILNAIQSEATGAALGSRLAGRWSTSALKAASWRGSRCCHQRATALC